MPVHTLNPNTGIDPSIPATQINIGVVTPDDTSGKYNIEAEPSGSVITDYKVRNRYFKDRNTFIAGVTSRNGFAGATVSMFQLATPTLIWVCEWTTCRVGIQSKLPDPNVDLTWVLLDDYYETFNLGLGPDGISPIYRVSGTYIYAKFSPALNTIDDVVFPSPPWLNDTGIPRTITQQDLQGGIISVTGTK